MGEERHRPRLQEAHPVPGHAVLLHPHQQLRGPHPRLQDAHRVHLASRGRSPPSRSSTSSSTASRPRALGGYLKSFAPSRPARGHGAGRVVPRALLHGACACSRWPFDFTATCSPATWFSASSALAHQRVHQAALSRAPDLVVGPAVHRMDRCSCSSCTPSRCWLPSCRPTCSPSSARVYIGLATSRPLGSTPRPASGRARACGRDYGVIPALHGRLSIKCCPEPDGEARRTVKGGNCGNYARTCGSEARGLRPGRPSAPASASASPATVCCVATARQPETAGSLMFTNFIIGAALAEALGLHRLRSVLHRVTRPLFGHICRKKATRRQATLKAERKKHRSHGRRRTLLSRGMSLAFPAHRVRG